MEVLLGTTVERIEPAEEGRLAAGSSSPGPRLRVCGSGLDREVDLVLVVVGVQPKAGLAVAAGVETGVRGAIRVSRRMETNLADVFAAGDCVETYHRLLARPVYIPRGTTAHKRGRVAGENAAGGLAVFQGSLGTHVVKVFDLAVARTGLSQREAAAAGFEAASTLTTEFDHKAYYPGAGRLLIKVHRGPPKRATAGRSDRWATQCAGRQADRHLRRRPALRPPDRAAPRPRPQLHAALRSTLGTPCRWPLRSGC